MKMKMKIRNIRIICSNNRTIFSGLVSQIPLKEEYIIAQSLEWFNESEPCIIHRTYVAKKFYIELYEKLLYFKTNQITEILCSKVSEFAKNIDLDISDASIFIDGV